MASTAFGATNSSSAMVTCTPDGPSSTDSTTVSNHSSAPASTANSRFASTVASGSA